MVEDVDADVGQSLRDVLGVGVGDLAEKDLGPDPDDFGPHGEEGARLAALTK
jgi:hypothetical protein